VNAARSTSNRLSRRPLDVDRVRSRVETSGSQQSSGQSQEGIAQRLRPTRGRQLATVVDLDPGEQFGFLRLEVIGTDDAGIP
jgi:hypothetical protein